MVETAIWLTEVAPQMGKSAQTYIDHLRNASHDANPDLLRLALKLATGAGKTTVMAMLIAWQTVNAVRHPNSKKFTRLYGHYDKTFKLWEQANIAVPPCFIIVCNNTATSKLVYDYIAGFQQAQQDGSSQLVEGRLRLFRNHDEHGNTLGRPRTLLIDSEQLESRDALDDKFRAMAADETERFRREILCRAQRRSALG